MCARLPLMAMDTFLLRVFQGQVEHQCQAVLVNDSLLRNAMNTDAPNQETIWAAIQGILTAAANISKALWGTEGRSATQREDLRTSIQVADTSPIAITRMRNHFDHFDERIDRWWKNSTNHNYADYIIGPDMFAMGLDVSDIFRHLNQETGEVIFWGDRYSLTEIVDEINRILPLVAAEAAKPHWDRPHWDQP
jgi:hypothetical protein